MAIKGVSITVPFKIVDYSQSPPTGKTGLSPTAVISKDGGAFSVSTNSISALAGGVYTLELTAAEMSVDTILIDFVTGDSDCYVAPISIITEQGKLADIETDTQAIETDTQDIQSTLSTPDDFKADVSALATAASLAVVDSNIDSIKAVTDTLTVVPSNVTVVSPVSESNDVTIFRGDDYESDDGTELSWTLTDYSGPSLTGATVKLRVLAVSSYDGSTYAADLEKTASVSGTTDITLTVELTDTETLTLSSNPPQDNPNYRYQIRAILANADVVTLVEGNLRVRKGIEAAS